MNGEARTALRRSAIVVAVILVAALLAGCRGNGTTNSNVIDGYATDVTLKTGGSMTLAAAQGISQLDPYKVLAAYELTLFPLLWSSLTAYTRTSGSGVAPSLATSWSSPDGYRTWKFTLRKGARFSDGRPISTADVVASLRRAFDPKTGFIVSAYMPKVETVTQPDADTVAIRLSEPFHALPALMPLVPIEDVRNVRTIDRRPVTTGPYKVAKFIPDQSIELVPNGGYFGGRPRFARITITKAQDNTAAVTALRAGDIQALWGIPWTDVRSLRNNPAVRVVTARYPSGNVLLEPDTHTGVFRDPRARQALAYSIDRSAIVRAVYGGQAIAPLGGVPVPPWTGKVTGSLPQYALDLDRAKKLFTAAGVTGRTKLTFWTTAGQYQEWTSIGEILQANLKKIGIHLEIRSVEFNQWVAKFAPTPKSFPNVIVANAYSGFAGTAALRAWAPSPEASWNDPAYNKAVSASQAATRPAAEQAALDRAQKIFNRQVPAVIVAQTSWPVGHVASIGGIYVDPLNMAHLEHAGYVK